MCRTSPDVMKQHEDSQSEWAGQHLHLLAVLNIITIKHNERYSVPTNLPQWMTE